MSNFFFLLVALHTSSHKTLIIKPILAKEMPELDKIKAGEMTLSLSLQCVHLGL